MFKKNQQYLFYIKGQRGSGYKRDPYARELTLQPPFPYCNYLIQSPIAFPWHDHDFHPPAFNDFMIYQFHVGTFFIKEGAKEGKFLDILDKT